MTKVCKDCGKRKPLEQFYFRGDRETRNMRCKLCYVAAREVRIADATLSFGKAREPATVLWRCACGFLALERERAEHAAGCGQRWQRAC